MKARSLSREEDKILAAALVSSTRDHGKMSATVSYSPSSNSSTHESPWTTTKKTPTLPPADKEDLLTPSSRRQDIFASHTLRSTRYTPPLWKHH